MARVLHVQKATGISGSERHILDLLPALAARGFEPQMALLMAPGGEQFADALRSRGVEVWTVPAGPDLNPAAVGRLAREMRRRRPDVVHTHLIHADLHAQAAARLAGIPAVSTVHSVHSWYQRQPYRSAAWLAGRLARRTIAISHFVGRSLTNGIVPSNRVRVVHYGIAAGDWASTPAERGAARREFGVGPEEVAVGMAARLIPGKGHASLIRSVATARAEYPLRLLLAGSGPLEDELTTVVKSAGLEDATTFLGWVDDPRRFMAACDLIAFPTEPWLGEGFGLSALEAQAAGRPVVATRVAALPEVVAHGQTGLVVDPDSAGALTEAVITLAGDRSLREQMGAKGHERASTNFSLTAMVDKTIAVYREVLR